MADIAGWLAPAATMIAAMMTAANLGARVTGGGFVVFTVGSIAWSIFGLASEQTNLVATNVFLTFVNLIGVWRWLGRQRAYEDGGKSAERQSRRVAAPDLFTATGLAGLPVYDLDGTKIGRTVEALLACDSGCISYVVVARGGVGGVAETLHAIDQHVLRFRDDRVDVAMNEEQFGRLPALVDGAWPGIVPTSSDRAAS